MKRIISISILIVAVVLVSATASAQYFTKNKAEHDSLAQLFAEKMGALMERDPELAQIIIINAQLSGDNITAKGHRTEFVSLPLKFEKQVLKDIASQFIKITNTLQANEMKVNATIREVKTVATSLAYVDSTVDEVVDFVRGMDQTVANLEVAVTEDRTPAQKQALEYLRKNAAFRAAAANKQ